MLDYNVLRADMADSVGHSESQSTVLPSARTSVLRLRLRLLH